MTFLVRLQSSSRPCDLRSSGASPSPRRSRAPGRPGGSRLPSTSTSPSSGCVEAVDQPQQLGAAGADQAAEADDLARADLRGSRSRTVGQPPQRRAPRAATSSAPTGALRVELLDLAADHQLDQLVGAACRPAGRSPTVRPSASTVTRSPIRRISSRRCEM